MGNYERPDILSIYDNKIVAIEHFEFDSYKNTRKGSNFKIQNNIIEQKMQKEIKELEKKRNNLRFNLFEEQDKIDDNKEKLIEEIEEKMKQKIEIEELFRIRWKII